MRRRTLTVFALLACLVAAPARAELRTADSELLKSVVEAYKSLNTRPYLLEGSINVDIRSASPRVQTAPFLVASDGGSRLRDEVKSAAVGGSIVSDGKVTYIYNGQLGQYLRREGRADSVLKGFKTRGVGSSLILRYQGIQQGAEDVLHRPDTTLTVDGVKRECMVIDVTYAPNPKVNVSAEPSTFWIDKQTRLVLHQRSILRADAPEFGGKVEQEENIVMVRASIDPKLPASLWKFEPPANAKLVKEFMQDRDAMASVFTGKPAIEFTLNDLKGQPHSLKDFRGKTVLLDFWATWCGPCRITMPQVAKIHEQYKAKGVEVMSINIGETAEKAGEYMTKNGYAFTTLLDQDRGVATQYQVNGIPTLVVINPKGEVSDYLVGARDEAALKAALTKAGVK
ncbi:MAG TPA: redoxin domain-containing protein [Candidatus Eisenbacteria bacterium]|nr:redoxin domain-containing protein [Candidatus Eisenbacteria bacterium]